MHILKWLPFQTDFFSLFTRPNPKSFDFSPTYENRPLVILTIYLPKKPTKKQNNNNKLWKIR